MHAPVICPICYRSGDDDRNATVTMYADTELRGGVFWAMDLFRCPRGHADRDLTASDERDMVAEALDWIDEHETARRDWAADHAHDLRGDR